jgi:hypothetical protein
MNGITVQGLAQSLVLAAAAVLAGCADASFLAPDGRAADALRPTTFAASARRDEPIALPAGCERLQPPAGSRLAHRLYAEGAQIYRWTGSAWAFVEPSAVLYAAPGGHGPVGTHYAGPTWESVSGSTVVGTADERCTPTADAIPWLRLRAVSSDGPGVFDRTTYIQRVNTVGGTAPAAPGSFVGEIVHVAYTAEYLFYRGS